MNIMAWLDSCTLSLKSFALAIAFSAIYSVGDLCSISFAKQERLTRRKCFMIGSLLA